MATSARRLALAAVFLLHAGAAKALGSEPALSQYVHQVWTGKEGLSSSTVTSLALGGDNHLWIGTAKGLMRFDGTELTSFGTDAVEALLRHSDGSLWIGMRTAGVARLDGSSIRPVGLGTKLSGTFVSSLAEDRKGNVLAATSGGMFEIDRKNTVRAVPELGSVGISAIAVDHEGAVWISSGERGMFRLSSGKVEPVPIKGLGRLGVNTLYSSPQGVLWGGTNDGRLLRFDRQGWRFVSFIGKIEGRVFALTEDEDGTMWVGTVGGGLYRMREGRVAVYDRRALRTTVVFALLSGSDGSLWIGTDGGGLQQLRTGRFVTFGEGEGVGPSKAVYEDSAGHVWFGTGREIIRTGKDGNRRYSKADGLPGDPIWSIAEHQGAIVAGTYGGGVWTLAGERFIPLLPKNGTSRDFVRLVTGGRDGSLWIATNRGLFRIRRAITEQPLGSDMRQITFVHEARDRSIWIGSSTGGGVVRWDGRSIHRFSVKAKGSDSVESILEDSAGGIWIGSTDNGLLRLRGGNLMKMDPRAGLPSTIVAIVEDRGGFLWMASLTGIYRVSREHLESYDPKLGLALDVRRFDALDGLRSVEFNSYGEPSMIIGRNGRLWVSGFEGPATIDTTDVPRMAGPQPLFRTVTVNGIPERASPGMAIGPPVSRLEIRFSALRLTGGDRNRYVYKLVGFEKGWHPSGADRTAEYTRVPPGRYELVVRAIDDGGAAPPAESRLAFTVRPAFHETLWFQICAVGTALALAIVVHRLLLFRIRNRAELLQRLVHERTAELEDVNRREIARLEDLDRVKDEFLCTASHELRTPLTAMRGALGLLANTSMVLPPEKYRRMVEIALANTERLIRLINDILDIERMKSGSMALSRSDCQAGTLIEQSVDSVRALFQQEQINVVVHSTTDPFVADPDRIVQTLTNLLWNAIKFSPPRSTIWVTAERRGEDIVFAVADQGRGIPAENLASVFGRFQQVQSSDATAKGGSGLGLAICQDIVHLHGGTIWVESQPGQGSRFLFSIPAPHSQTAAGGPHAEGFSQPLLSTR